MKGLCLSVLLVTATVVLGNDAGHDLKHWGMRGPGGGGRHGDWGWGGGGMSLQTK